MKAVILAGGFGTRLSEETHLKPKPMVEIGGKPILWHIMKIYSYYGINEFIICLGYKGYVIKEFFINYFNHQSDLEIDLQKNQVKILNKKTEDWKVTLVDTDVDTMTGGRIKRIKEYVKDEDCFCCTYGDGVADINIKDLISFHKSKNRLATLTGVYPPGRFGALKTEGDMVKEFQEKPKGDGGLINGGFFVLSPKVLNYINDDSSIWEQDPLKNLAEDNQLNVYRHNHFWCPMDTLRDKTYLENLIDQNKAPWIKW
jgi:glucose-1-phosphate cytidylyltransferase